MAVINKSRNEAWKAFSTGRYEIDFNYSEQEAFYAGWDAHKLYAATPPRADAEVDDAMVERVAVAIHNEARRGTFRGPWGGQFSDYQNRIRDQARAALAAAINQGEKK